MTDISLNEAGATCGGNKPIGECETTQAMMQGAVEHASQQEPRPHQRDEGYMWNTLAWIGKKCAGCAKVCEIAVQTNNGVTTERMRMAFVIPDPSAPTVKINVKEYRGATDTE